MARGWLAPATCLSKDNPARDIHDMEHVELVFKDGVGYVTAKPVQAANDSIGLR